MIKHCIVTFMTEGFILIALIAYTLAAILLAFGVGQTTHRSPASSASVDASERNRVRLTRMGLLLAGVAITCHGASLVISLFSVKPLSFSYFQATSLLGFGVVLVVWLTALFRPVAILGVLIFPIAALVAVTPLIFSQVSYAIATDSIAHVIMGMLGFGFFTAAAAQALLLRIQDQRLKHPEPGRIMAAMPPLDTMESLLFSFVTAGFVTLSGILLSGFVLSTDLFADHLIHKAILTIIVWLLFGVLLFGRAIAGWRGRTAVRYTLIGYVVLLIAYFGSKSVLEFALGQHWG